MALQTYGGYTWSNQAPPELNPDSHKLLGLGFIGSALALGGYTATRNLQNGYRPIDYAVAATRLGTNLSPMQLLNTFRIPEILSPYLSDKYRSTGSSNYGIWNRADIANNSSYQWIKNQTGLSDDALKSAGITSGMLGADHELAKEVRYKPGTGIRGTLVSVMGDGTEREISKDISLQAFNTEVLNPFTTSKGINKYAEGVVAASGVNDIPGVKVNDIFSAQKVHPGYIPVASPIGSIEKAGDLGRRTALLRGIPAFEMARFGNLLTEVTNQFFGNTGKKFLTNVLHLPSEFRPTSATKMFGKYGLAAAGVVGAGLVVQQTDWMRETFGTPGRIGASALISGGVGHLASRMGMNSHKSFMLALGAFAGQMALPGFDKGLFEGVATVGANLDVMRATPINPFSLYRRTLEGLAPGSTDWQTGAFLGIAGTVLATQNIPILNQRLPLQYAKSFGIPLVGTNFNEMSSVNTSIKDIFYDSLGAELNSTTKTKGFFNRLSLKREYLAGPDSLARLHSMNQKFYEAEERFASIQSNNPLNTVLSDKLKAIHGQAGIGLWNDIKKDWSGFAQEAWHDLWGADLSRNKVMQEELRDLGFGKFAPTTKLGRAGIIFSSILLGHQLLTGGLLGSMDSAESLRDTYSGKKLVEIKKNRYWEGGGTPYEGSDTSYYRPHQYALMMNDVRDKGIWGDEADRSPLTKAFLKNFTYHLEEKNYWNRPYPITGQAFSDIPIIGGILGASVGQLIKPTKVMHSSEWIRERGSGLEYANVFKGNMMEPAYELGAVGQGVPQMPNSFRALHADMTDQFRELEGMCFVGSTLVTTLNGYKPIKDVLIGDFVLSIDGQYREVIDTISFENHSKPLVKVAFSNLGTSFVCTDNHWIPILRDNKTIDIQVKDITKKDYLIVPTPKDKLPDTLDLASCSEGPVGRYLYWRRASKEYIQALEYIEEFGDQREGRNRTILPELNRAHVSHAAKTVRNNVQVKRWGRYIDLQDPDVLWFLGWFVAEGSTEIVNSRICFTLGWKERKEADILKRIGVEKFGCIPNEDSLVENSSIAIRFSHGPLLHWLRETFGKNCYEKHVPEFIKQLPKELLVHFASGLCLGDGWAGGFKSSSGNLVKDVMTILIKFGICAHQQINKVATDGLTYSQLFITKRHIDRYTRLLNREVPVPIYENPNNRNTAFIRGDVLYTPIRSIEYLDYSETVYDLTIEEQHYYVASMVAVHNTGFAKNTMFGALFGQERWNTDATRLASSSDMTSLRDHFWEMEMGGALFTNEFVRRVLPRKKAAEQSSNPIMNSMPSWIPDKYRWGDPYKSVAWGEARMPGPGFVALHPELSGLDPEAYPMMYKYQILADIAPFAPETFKIKNQLYANRSANKLSESETKMMDEIDTRHSKVTARYDFNEMDERAIAIPGSGITRSIYGAGKQTLRDALEPGEYMIPMGFRPSQKLLGMRDPINQYEYERMYGTSLAFWNEPWRDWLRPAMYSAAHSVGYSGKPIWRQEANQTNEYFDQLQFFKSMFLAENAKQMGLDPGKAASLRIQAGQTRAGYTDTTNPLSTYWSLPTEDRAFFNSFANADPAERKRIKQMIPSDQVAIYEDMWRRVDSGDPSLYNMGNKANAAAMQSKYEGMKQTMPLPDGGWLGWNSEVDLDDVKARYVDRIGADMHDYSIWEAGMRKSEAQPFLDGSENFLFNQSYSTFSSIQSRVYNQIGDGMNSPKISMNEYPGKPYAHIDYNDSRDNVIANKLNRYINGY